MATIAALLIALAAAPAGGPGAWWVFFADRGPSLDSRLESASEALASSPSSARREAAGVRGALETDLEPWQGYLLAVEDILGPGSIRTTSRYLDAASVRCSEAEAGALLELPFVSAVRPVGRGALEPEPSLPGPQGNDLSSGQLGQTGIDSLQARGYTGAGIVLGVLDTGFDLVHPAFSSTIVLAQWDFLDDDPDPSQQPGDAENQSLHGTRVLSIIGGREEGLFTGGAWGASFFLAKTEDISGEYPQEEDFWVEGLEWLDSCGVRVVSSSLGYVDWYGYEDLDGNTAVTTIAADIAASHGMPVVNAVGNLGPGPGTLNAPSDGDSVFAVGAVDSQDLVAGFSSRGPTADGRIKPDACARGVDCVLVAGSTGYTWGNGTSFATPLVSSAAALLLEAHPEWTSLEALEALRLTASQAQSPDNDYGWGVVDANDALRWNSITGCVRWSDTGELLPHYPLSVTCGGPALGIESNGSGWFAVDPGALGPFAIEGGPGPGTVLPVYGTLGAEGVDLTIYVENEAFGLQPSAFPSPTTGGAWFGFDLPAGADVVISVLDLSGRPVRIIECPGLEAGSHRAPLPGEAVWWDGNDADGNPAASGTYIAVLRLGDAVELVKFAVVR